MKNKLLLLIISCIVLLFLSSNIVQAAPEDNQNVNNSSATEEKTTNLQGQLAEMDLSKMENYINDINRQMDGFMPQVSAQTLITDMVSGKVNLSISAALQGILKYFFKEVVANYKLLLQLMILAIVCAVLDNLQEAFDNGTTGKIAHGVVYLVLIAIAVNSFTIALNTGKEAIDNMLNFMYAILPLLLTLLVSLGNIASATLLHPLSFAVLGFMSTFVKNVIFPLIFLSVIVGLVSNISDKFKISRLSGFIKNIGIFLLGLLFTLFIGFLSVQGIGGSVADGVALRTAKFATGAIPIVGKMFSDTLDAVAGTSLLLKNALGIVGVVVIFLLAIFPVLKLVAIMLIYRFCAAIAQPVVDEKIVKCLDHMANSITMVFAAVATVSLMFFFMVTIIVGAGDITVMMR